MASNPRAKRIVAVPSRFRNVPSGIFKGTVAGYMEMALSLDELRTRLAKAQAVVNGEAPADVGRFDPMEDLRRITDRKKALHWDGTVERAMLILGMGKNWAMPAMPWTPPWEKAGLSFKAWDNRMARERGDPPIWETET